MPARVLNNCILCALLFFYSSVYSAEFQPWSENIFLHVEKMYGAPAAKRMRYLHDLILKNRNLPAPEKLKLINDTMNRLPWIADEKHWKNVDYWATPLETITTFGGDCEDIAIAKWVALTHIGIESKHLALAYVRIKQTSENHMVLLYIERPDLPPAQQTALILDNYVPVIMKASERTDLLAVYATDANGKLVLIADNGNARTIKAVFEDRKLQKIEDLKKKVAATREKFKKLNEGRPSFSP